VEIVPRNASATRVWTLAAVARAVAFELWTIGALPGRPVDWCALRSSGYSAVHPRCRCAGGQRDLAREMQNAPVKAVSVHDGQATYSISLAKGAE
jgi:hypothetical protein